MKKLSETTDQGPPEKITGYGGAAPVYLERGWVSPLPLEYRTKAPPEDGGYTGHDAKIPTVDQLGKWIDKYPNGNIALRLPPGVIGIDVDAYPKKSKDGKSVRA